MGDLLVGRDAPAGVEVRAGLVPTSRELEVLQTLAPGWTDAEDAERMGGLAGDGASPRPQREGEAGARTRFQAVAMVIARELVATR